MYEVHRRASENKQKYLVRGENSVEKDYFKEE